MGCIEISDSSRYVAEGSWINRNMGCIEITFRHTFATRCFEINRNMGCIEIGNESTGKDGLQGLIETWDVLK